MLPPSRTSATLKTPAKFILAALYKFIHLPDYADMREPLLKLCKKHDICGSVLLAEEGINATIAGSKQGLQVILDHLQSDPRLADIAPKFATHDEAPFKRIKIRLKKEIVTLGIPSLAPNDQRGTPIKPKDWNDIITSPNMMVIDTRNDYETQIGTFENAVDPKIKTFREFPDWVEKLKQEMADKPNHEIAMFCTGGIRCEKASALMRKRGFPKIYHLEGGILKYLEHIPAAKSKWHGECFVFDERVAVGHDLIVGTFSNCAACGRPLSPEDLRLKGYEPGVSCRHCIGAITEDQIKRFRMRQRNRSRDLRVSTFAH
jgi:UPF0176 protein